MARAAQPHPRKDIAIGTLRSIHRQAEWPWKEQIVLHPVCVHPGDSVHAHGVTMPDFPGCFSAANDWQDLPRRVQEAVEVWCVGEDLDLPEPTALEKLACNAKFSGGVRMLIDIDVTRLDTHANQRPVRINVSIPAVAHQRVDPGCGCHLKLTTLRGLRARPAA